MSRSGGELAANNNLVYVQDSETRRLGDSETAARIRSGTFNLWLIVSASMAKSHRGGACVLPVLSLCVGAAKVKFTYKSR